MKKLIVVALIVVGIASVCSAEELTPLQIAQKQLESANAQKVVADSNYTLQTNAINSRIARATAKVAELTGE